MDMPYHDTFYHGSFYHIFNRSINNEIVFRSRRNYLFFIGRWEKYIGELLEVYAYCLLPTHFHFFARVPESFAKLEKFRKAGQFKGVDVWRKSAALFSFILFSSCASVVTNIRVKEDELRNLKDAEKIVVISKDGSSHKIKHVTVDDNKICSVEHSFLRKAKPIVFQPDEIEGVFIKGVRGENGRIITEKEIARNRISSSRFFLPIVAGFGSFIPAVYFSFMVSGADFSDEQITGMQGDIFSVTFYSTVFLMTYGGYKLGKHLDDRLAVKKIKKKRKYACFQKRN